MSQYTYKYITDADIVTDHCFRYTNDQMHALLPKVRYYFSLLTVRPAQNSFMAYFCLVIVSVELRSRRSKLSELRERLQSAFKTYL